MHASLIVCSYGGFLSALPVSCFTTQSYKEVFEERDGQGGVSDKGPHRGGRINTLVPSNFQSFAFVCTPTHESHRLSVRELHEFACRRKCTGRAVIWNAVIGLFDMSTDKRVLMSTGKMYAHE